MAGPIPGFLKSRAARAVILAVLALEAVVVAAVFYSERAYLKRESKIIRFGDASKLGRIWVKVEGPGINRPPTRRAEEAKLSDDEEVIGIVADGKARAYRVGAFEDRERHIVNDLIGDRPVTVAYCNLSDCARAYAGPRGGRPLDVSQAGAQRGEMILKVGETYYWHRTAEPLEEAGGGPPFPFPSHPLMRRKWGQWRREHPDTDVYLGLERRAAP